MNVWFILGIVAFFAGTMLNRSLTAKAYESLDEPQRTVWAETFARLRWSQVLPPVVLVGLFFLGMRYLPNRLPLLSALFWLGLLGFVALSGAFTFHRLGSKGLSGRPQRYWALGQVARWGGLLALFCGFFVQMRV